MPTYVYRRTDGTTFEAFQRITDDALTVDPETGQPVQRVISGGAGLQFKGTGFYQTDYVKKSGTPDKTESSDSAKTPKATTDTPSSSDAAPASPSTSAKE